MRIAVVDEAVKVHPVGVIEHARRLHDGLEPFEGRLRHDRRRVPRVDVLVALHDLREHGHARVRKLRSDDLGGLGRVVLGDPFQRAGDRIGKALHHVRVLPDVRLRGEVGRVRDLAALLPDGREDISLARLRDLGGRRLKERDKIAVAAGERPGHHVELHRRIHIGIRAGDNAVLPHDVFERHLRHAACRH